MSLLTDVPAGGGAHTQHHRDLATAAMQGVRMLDLGTVTAVGLLSGPVTLYTPASGEIMHSFFFRNVTLCDVGYMAVTSPDADWLKGDDSPGFIGSSITEMVDTIGAVAYGARTGHAGGQPVPRGAAAFGTTSAGSLSITTINATATAFYSLTGSEAVMGAWQTNHTYLTGHAVVQSGHVWYAGNFGEALTYTSGGSLPDFAGHIGGTVGDNGITWTDAGAVPTAGSVHIYALVGIAVTP